MPEKHTIEVVAYRDEDGAPKMEAPVRQIVSVSSIDIEKMLAECVPGGSVCDPQEVADNIHRYCKAWISTHNADAAGTAPKEMT